MEEDFSTLEVTNYFQGGTHHVQFNQAMVQAIPLCRMRHGSPCSPSVTRMTVGSLCSCAGSVRNMRREGRLLGDDERSGPIRRDRFFTHLERKECSAYLFNAQTSSVLRSRPFAGTLLHSDAGRHLNCISTGALMDHRDSAVLYQNRLPRRRRRCSVSMR